MIPIRRLASSVKLGTGHVYVGELPGLTKALSLLGGTKALDDNNSSVDDHHNDDYDTPGIVLGLDFLQQTYRMLLRIGTAGVGSNSSGTAAGKRGGETQHKHQHEEEEEVWFEELHNQPRYSFSPTIIST